MTNPVTGAAGLRVRFLDVEGGELFAEDRFSSRLVYLGGDAPVDRAATIELTTRWTPDLSGTVRIGCAAVGTIRLLVDGELLAEHHTVPVGDDPAAAVLAPPAFSAPADVEAGRPVDLRVVLEPLRLDGLGAALGITIGVEPAHVDPDALLAGAAATAAAADVAVVVVGTTPAVESEGHDRTDLALPGRQDDLVRAVAAANARTIVVVNAGSPVLLPWRDEVAAILVTYFPGQEFGRALAEVLTGRSEPGGRLPTTWPATQEDVPVIDVTPTGGQLRYDEDIHVGYRAWLRSGVEPAFPFGHGLGYTTWELGRAAVDHQGTSISVAIPVTNTGARPGKQVVQVYAERPRSAVERPARWLVGSAVVRAAPGVTTEARIAVPRRAFAHWEDGWRIEPGDFDLRVGTSVVDLDEPISVEVDADGG